MRLFWLPDGVGATLALGRDQEGVEVVYEFFGTLGPLEGRWGWWRRARRRGWGGRRGAAVAVHRQGG